MPLHTDRTAKMKLTYGQRFPKDLQEHSAKTDNKFLNDNLHTIEEMECREKGITDGFKEYQNKYYDRSGILNHDLYFTHNGKIIPKVSGAQPLNIMNAGFVGSLALRTEGTEFISNTGAGGLTNYGANSIWASLCASVTNGGWYDQIAISSTNSTGNIALACYDDSSTTPNNLLASEAGNAANSAYTYRAVTEFQINSTVAWLACNMSSSSYTSNYQGSGTAYYKTGQTYVTIANPFPASPTFDGAEQQMKCGHT